ncbi:hypothetical protein HZH68_010098 [Vespula germanica]|uniref:Fatty acid desaturase domain-containing protein n=1 Tax=Vespula germanica TaxID=30212 RepID=A0A834N6G0_VESGE|nr:hypothetical protein HZH68_010098 [Vespula germanica]
MVKDLHKISATLSLKELQQDILQENSTIREESWPMSNLQNSQKSEPKYKWKIVWKNVIIFLYFHIGAIYGAYLFFTVVRWYTVIFCLFTLYSGLVGITAGAHRLWTHKSYKAKWPMRVILMICQTIAFQNHIYEWVRDHRVHHKYTDTDADPHNAKRGFFFSHIGWLMLKKHPDVIKKGATIDMSDLEKDPVVVWQRKYISPTDSYSVGITAIGEGWHNYHHVFPWDYKTSELNSYSMNFTTAVIDGFAKLGWAYDLKTVSPEMIQRRAARTGDGTKYHLIDHEYEHTSNNVWGWDDSDMIPEDIQDAKILNKCD